MIKQISPVVVLERLQARASRSRRFAASAPVAVEMVWQAERSFATVELTVAGFTIGQALKGVR